MQFKASALAQLLGGQIEGNPESTVSGFGKIESAVSGQLSFLANPKYEDYLYTCQASIVIVNQSLTLRKPVTTTLIRVPDAYAAFAQLLALYEEQQKKKQNRHPISLSHRPQCEAGRHCFHRCLQLRGRKSIHR